MLVRGAACTALLALLAIVVPSGSATPVPLLGWNHFAYTTTPHEPHMTTMCMPESSNRAYTLARVYDRPPGGETVDLDFPPGPCTLQFVAPLRPGTLNGTLWANFTLTCSGWGVLDGYRWEAAVGQAIVGEGSNHWSEQLCSSYPTPEVPVFVRGTLSPFDVQRDQNLTLSFVPTGLEPQPAGLVQYQFHRTPRSNDVYLPGLCVNATLPARPADLLSPRESPGLAAVTAALALVVAVWSRRPPQLHKP